MSVFWEVLFEADVDVVLSGHDHHYERFAPQTPEAQPYAKGIRAFVVGTGGKTLRPVSTQESNIEIIIDDQFGVLFMTLHDGFYDWTFRSTNGHQLDAGLTECF